MYREPKGVFGKTIDSLLIKVNLFEGNTYYFVKIYKQFEIYWWISMEDSKHV